MLPASPALRRWRAARIIFGLTMIVAILVMIGRGLHALHAGTDTRVAMKVPFFLAFTSAFLFVHCVRRILRTAPRRHA